MTTMNAALLPKTGRDSILTYSSVPFPRQLTGYALVRVAYCGVNHLDLLIKQGKRVGPKHFPHILGSEIVGTIESIASNKAGLRSGDTVAVYPWTFCGRCAPCRSGSENICDAGGTIGRTSWGGYAEYVVAPIRNLIKFPRSLSGSSVCALTLAGTTAYHLIDRAQIPDKSTVLVTGASGGVGTIVLQLLKQKNCTVIATTSHKKKASRLKKLGADRVVPTKHLTEAIKKSYPRGIPYVIDIMGGEVWSAVTELVAKNGTMVYCATTLDGWGTVNIGSAFSRQINLVGSYGGMRKDLQAVIRLLKKGVIKPIVDSTYSLQEANNALEKLEKQRVFGKILLQPFS